MAAVISIDNERPALVLTDTAEDLPGPAVRRPRRHARQSRWENLFFVFAAAAVIAFVVIAGVQSLQRSVNSSGHDEAVAVSLPVTVHHGDTLWAYAQKYGASNTYILDRVESIAAANHLAPDSALVPGERLRIPVTNAILLAKIENNRRLASAKH